MGSATSGRGPDRLQVRAVSGAIQIGSMTAPLAPVLGGALLTVTTPNRAVAVYAAYLVVLAVAATAGRGLREAGAAGAGLLPGPRGERS